MTTETTTHHDAGLQQSANTETTADSESFCNDLKGARHK